MKTQVLIAVALFFCCACSRPPEQQSITWAVKKEQDAFTDARTCSVVADGPVIAAFRLTEDGASADVSFADLTKPVRLRIDQNAGTSGFPPFKGENASPLLNQVRQGGQRLLVGYYHPDSRAERILELNLNGVTEQLQECEEWIRPVGAQAIRP